MESSDAGGIVYRVPLVSGRAVDFGKCLFFLLEQPFAHSLEESTISTRVSYDNHNTNTAIIIIFTTDSDNRGRSLDRNRHAFHGAIAPDTPFFRAGGDQWEVRSTTYYHLPSRMEGEERENRPPCGSILVETATCTKHGGGNSTGK
jgi:hypothetical protein